MPSEIRQEHVDYVFVNGYMLHHYSSITYRDIADFGVLTDNDAERSLV
jgi:hypothetical protein